MRDFSLESATDEIYHDTTNQYFAEVLSSYNNENYRSAIVMLYTIVVCDLVYKLEALQEEYNDQPAKEILTKIKEIQEKRPNSGDWEKLLIELVNNRTNLLDASDYANILSLEKHRHLCAHPVLNQNYELYNPNKETVRAHMRNMLEGIFMKPPLFSRKIFTDFVIDLEKNKELIREDSELYRYLSTKYFSRFTQTVTLQIFKSLWKIVFKAKDERANLNRDINFKALKMLLEYEDEAILEFIEKDKEGFSDIDIDFIVYIIDLLNEEPQLVFLLTEPMQVLIQAKIKESPELTASAVFATGNVKAHLKMLQEKKLEAPFRAFAAFDHWAHVERCEKELLDYVVWLFGNSGNYNTADARYSILSIYLEKLNGDQLKNLLQEMNSNSQIYSRMRAFYTNSEIVKRCVQVLGADFDFSPFPNLKYSLL